jgi:hypothetical protein
VWSGRRWHARSHGVCRAGERAHTTSCTHSAIHLQHSA